MARRSRTNMYLAAALLSMIVPQSAVARTLTSHSKMEHAAARVPLIHPGVLTVGSDTSYPPMESTDVKRGGYKGADVDLANALAKAMGLRGAKIVSSNFDTIIPSLQRHNFDVIMSSMSDTPERRKQIDFVDYMRLRAAEAVLVPKSSSLKVGGYGGLCGHSVSVEAGTVELTDLQTADKKCRNKITIRTYTADTAAFQAMAAGHVDSYTTDLPIALFYAKQYGNVVQFAGKPFGSGGKYGIGVLKSARPLRTALVKALRKIRSNGQYIRILTRYGLRSTAI